MTHFPSHRVPCSMKGNKDVRSSTTTDRLWFGYPELPYSLDMSDTVKIRGAKLEASQQQHS
eukprot:1153375-Pelagomonas_calceolata.AAC.1